MNFQPKVSIIIPVFNGSNYLREAIDSALAQTYQNIEIIVVNDGSTDNGATEHIALSYSDRICYFSKKNGGVASALNLAIDKMTGEYFSWLSHDDLYFVNKVEAQINALDQMQDKRVVLYSDFAVFYNSPDKLSEVKLPSVRPEHFRYFLTTRNSLNGCSLLIPATAFVECGLFDEKLRTTQDYDLWFRMAEKYKFVHLSQTLVKGRSHSEQDSIKMKDTALAECNNLCCGFVDKLSEHEIISATKKSIGRSYAEISASFQKRGFHRAAKHAADLTMKNISRGSFLDVLKSLVLLFRIKVIDPKIGQLRTIYVSLRIKVRKCLN